MVCVGAATAVAVCTLQGEGPLCNGNNELILPPHHRRHLLHYSNGVRQMTQVVALAAAAQAGQGARAVYQVADVARKGCDLPKHVGNEVTCDNWHSQSSGASACPSAVPPGLAAAAAAAGSDWSEMSACEQSDSISAALTCCRGTETGGAGGTIEPANTLHPNGRGRVTAPRFQHWQLRGKYRDGVCRGRQGAGGWPTPARSI